MADGISLPPGYQIVNNAPPSQPALPDGYKLVEAPGMSWGDVGAQAIQNAPESALNFGKALVQPILHPIQTVQALGDLGAGALRAGAQKVLPASVVSAIDSVGSPEDRDRATDTASAVGKMLTERYGSVEALKQTLAKDPVGAAADLSIALGGLGGMAAKLPGAAGKVGEAAQTVASVVDPVQNVGRAVSGAVSVLPKVLGVTTGAGARPFQEAFKAGQEANPAFTDAMRGKSSINDAIDMAEGAAGKMQTAASNQYKSDMALVKSEEGIKQSIRAARQGGAQNPLAAPIDMQPVYEALNDARGKVYYNDKVPISQEAADTLGKIGDVVRRFDRVPGAPDVARFDALKQAVWEVYKGAKPGTLESRVAKNVYDTIKSEIMRQAPSYADAMKNYGNAADEIGQFRQTFSLNNKASDDTIARKLLSALRNNVNTNFGKREEMIDQAARFEANLPATLSGHAVNSWEPRGLQRLGAFGAAVNGLHNPLALAALPFASPRLMGEGMYYAGRGAGGVNALLKGRVSGDAIRNALMSAYAANALSAPRTQQ